MKRISKGWLLPIVFLAGYLFAWGTILIDRQMIIEEQSRLQDEVDRTRIELKISKMIDDYGDDWQEMVIWNEKAVEEPEQKGEEK